MTRPMLLKVPKELNCGSAKRYKGIYPPTCNGGNPCVACVLKYDKENKCLQEILEKENYFLWAMAKITRRENNKWWVSPKTGRKLRPDRGTKYSLMHSELSEAFEGLRKNKMDDHPPHLHAEPVELADLYIRLMDYVGEYYPDEFAQAVVEKRAYNKTRADHTNKARLAEGGKKF